MIQKHDGLGIPLVGDVSHREYEHSKLLKTLCKKFISQDQTWKSV